MARRLRIRYPAAIYHVMARGVRKLPLFIDDLDRQKFLRLCAAIVKRYDCLCYSYNLMGNHYHVVIQTPRPNISRAMQYLNGEYAKYFNRRHECSGHVFGERFRSPLIEDSRYLVDAIAYIERNPVTAGLVSNAIDWRWSSYRALVGKCTCPAFLNLDWLPRLVKSHNLAASRQLFSAVVHKSDTEDRKLPIAFGGKDFQRSVRKVIGATLYETSLPRAFRAMGQPPLGEIFAGVKKSERRTAIRRAHVVHGYLLTEIARYLDLHPTTISRILNRTGSYRRR
jgi:putative transposase